MGCETCEALPGRLSPAVDLYLSFPLEASARTAEAALASAGVPVDVNGPDLRVAVAAGAAADVARALAAALNQAERQDGRALEVVPGRVPDGESLRRMAGLETWIGQARAQIVREVLSAGSLDNVFQPIVPAGETTRPFAYEVLLRARRADGSGVPPHELFALAAQGGLIHHLDREARLRAIRQARAWGVFERGLAFINFVPSSIYNPAFCLRTTEAAVEEAGVTPDQVVFEVLESERADPAHLTRILQHYRQAGYRIALDDLGSGYSSLGLMASLRPDFVKLDMGLVRGVAADPYRAGMLDALLSMARSLEVATIAEGVETGEDLAWVRDHGATYVQGYAIARPGCPPPLA